MYSVKENTQCESNLLIQQQLVIEKLVATINIINHYQKQLTVASKCLYKEHIIRHS